MDKNAKKLKKLEERLKLLSNKKEDIIDRKILPIEIKMDKLEEEIKSLKSQNSGV